MKKIKFTRNHKNGIVHVFLKYKYLQYLDKLLPLLNVSALTVLHEDYRHVFKRISETAKHKIVDVIRDFENNPDVPTLLLWDGYVTELFEDDEIKYLLEGTVRLFIVVEYSTNEIHLFINGNKYDDIERRLTITFDTGDGTVC